MADEHEEIYYHYFLLYTQSSFVNAYLDTKLSLLFHYAISHEQHFQPVEIFIFGSAEQCVGVRKNIYRAVSFKSSFLIFVILFRMLERQLLFIRSQNHKFQNGSIGMASSLQISKRFFSFVNNDVWMYIFL